MICMYAQDWTDLSDLIVLIIDQSKNMLFFRFWKETENFDYVWWDCSLDTPIVEMCHVAFLTVTSYDMINVIVIKISDEITWDSWDNERFLNLILDH